MMEEMEKKEYLEIKKGKGAEVISRLLLITFALLTGLSVIYWLVNLNRIIAELKFTNGAWQISPYILKPLFIFPGGEGLYKFLYDISVDFSSATSILTVLFFAPITINLWRLSTGKLKTDYFLSNISSFPFSQSAKNLWIQLGLLGTLWGFLLIGQNMKPQNGGLNQNIINILIIAFGTALISTFVGVFLAYILGPLTTNLSKLYLNRISATELPSPAKTLPEYFRKLQITVNEFNKSLSESAYTLEKVTKTIEKVERQLDFPFREVINKVMENMEVMKNFHKEENKKLFALTKSIDFITKGFNDNGMISEYIKEEKENSTKIIGAFEHLRISNNEISKAIHDDLPGAIANSFRNTIDAAHKEIKKLQNLQESNKAEIINQINTVSTKITAYLLTKEDLDRSLNHLPLPSGSTFENLEGTVSMLNTNITKIDRGVSDLSAKLDKKLSIISDHHSSDSGDETPNNGLMSSIKKLFGYRRK